MPPRNALFAVLCCAAGITPAEPAEPPLFPAAADVGSGLAVRPGADFAVGEDGTFCIDGAPRYLLGTVFYNGFGADELRPGPGYAPENAWIYETPPDAAYLRRLGFDTFGGEVSASWMRRYRPETNFWRAARGVDWRIAVGWWRSGLPGIVDFTAATWAHGGIAFKEGREPAARAFVDDPAGRCHFLSYSLVTDEGRDVWRTFWRAGAEELKAHGAEPYAFELFNEPAYDDRSPGAREAFAAFLSARFGGDPAAMDAAWGSAFGSFEAAAAFERPNESAGLGVEWLKFREAAFAGGVALGRDTIREVYPDARVGFQPLGHLVAMERVLAAEPLCQVAMTPTGGGDLWQTALVRAWADGKPIVDGETYLGRTRASHRAAVLRQFARGIDASYVFKWERRLADMPDMDEASLRRLADRFPWMELNPAAVPTEALAGLMDAKRDVAVVQDLFGPRDRGIPPDRRIAVLSSLPTSRLAEAAGLRCHAFEREAALALAVGAHVPVDAIFEEQLPEGRLDRYRVLVAAGVAATYPATRGILRDWVERGGTLILVGEAMELDEYARPSPSDFPGIALGEELGGEPFDFGCFGGCDVEAVPYREAAFEADWEPVSSCRGELLYPRLRIGKGRVIYLGSRFPDLTAEGYLLASLAYDAGVRRLCRTLDPATREPVDDIEVHAACGADGAVGYIVENRGLAPRAVRFFPRGFFQTPVLADVSRRVILGPDKEGAVLLLLEPHVPVVLRGAPTRSALEAALAAAPRAWNEGASSWDSPPSERGVARSAGGSTPSAAVPAPSTAPSRTEYSPSLAPLGSPLSEGAKNAGHSAFSIQHSALPIEPYSEVAAHAAEWLAAHTSASRARAKAFSVDPARVKFLDLRDAATVSYDDRVADDGKGGWTDQGENCLENAPWGVTDCNGVPFDFIRPDQNGGRAAVILRSTRQPWLPEAVRGIRVDARAEALWFLHASAFPDPGKEAFRYVVRYADGTSLALPMRAYVDFEDWWVRPVVPGGRDAMRCKRGWANAESRGFGVLRWENPFPEKTIATIDIESAGTKTAPIVEAITAELARGDLRAVPVSGAPTLRPWGGARGELVPHAEFAETAEPGGPPSPAAGRPASGIQHPALSFDSARPWAGCTLQFPEPSEIPGSAGRADLEFLLAAPDARPLPPLQLRVGSGGGYVPLDSFLRETGVPGAWRVSFPLDLAAGGLRAPFRELSLQLRGERPEGSAAAVSVSCVRILADGGPEESPLALRRLLAKGSHGVEAIRRDGGIELAVDDRTEDWGLGRLSPVRAVPLPEDPATAVLAFDVNGGRTPLGRRDRGRHRFRARLGCATADGGTAEGPWVRDPEIEDGAVDDDPDSWQTVRIPLAKLLPEGATALARLTIQFTGLPESGRAGLLVRDFRIESRKP